MGRIVVAEYLSLDGVIEAPENWVFPYWNDELGAFTDHQLQASEAMLLGRKTYDIFAASWPSRTNDEHADLMNAIPKYVTSNSLEHADWNNSSVLRGDPVEAARGLKAQTEGALLVWGSATLVRAVLAHGLVDELRLFLFPVVVGTGARLFATGAPQASMRLVQSQQTPSGTLILTYAPSA